jgi:arylsulfatase A-like enzyme
MATLSGLLNTPLSKDAGEDSYNLWPAFIGKKSSSNIREATIHHSERGFFSIRKGKWKFTPHLGSGGFSVPVNLPPKEGEAPGTLYDLNNDPGEQTNLYQKYPEVVKELGALLKKYLAEGHSREL